MAIVEGFRRFSDLLRCSRVLVKTDQKALSFIFSRNTSRIKSEKLVRWRLELSQYNFDISYHKGCDNVSADALSRLASLENKTCQQLHRDLAHAGITRLYEYVQRYKLPFSVQEVRKTVTDCQTCALWKPKFYQPPKQQLIQSTRPWERLSIDIVGPKEISQSGNQYLLTVIDEYSRFPFAFPLRKITSSSVKGCLAQLFSIFGPPSFIHSDRGTQFQSEKFQEFCFSRGIGLSRTSPYHPKGNGQNERYNGVIWKSVQCLLHSEDRKGSAWEDLLPGALYALRTLINTVTRETPHDRLFNFTRKAGGGVFAQAWWIRAGSDAYLKKHVRNKDEVPVIPVKIVEVITPNLTRVSFPDGRIDTVSAGDLSRRPTDDTLNIPSPASEDVEIANRGSQDNDVPVIDDDQPAATVPEETATAPRRSNRDDDQPAATVPEGTTTAPRRSNRVRNKPKHLEDYEINIE